MRRIPHLMFALLILLTPTHSKAGDAGDAGALFLRMGMGGRATGMGEAFTAVAKDASALYWNPGAMSAVLGTEIMFMHSEYFQSLRLEQLALTHETEYGTIGLGFTGLYMDEMDRYEDIPSAIPLGTFSAYDVAFTVAFSRYVIPNLSVGVAVKPVYQKIDETTATGVAFDAGLYHVSMIPGVKFAAVITNVGPPMKFEEEEYALPRTIKLGASYERDIPSLKSDVLVTLDVIFPNDASSVDDPFDDTNVDILGEISKEHFGLEWVYSRMLFLRTGFKSGYDSQGATVGLGVRYQQFMLDYGVLFGSNDLGDSHRISLSLRV
ncbi:MAG: PorV/PorQ family protein [Candidatus Latescibacterota bacterium]|nr:MAG: PorV/PorQ family protein [Candidatus Latescibacterota bacterium]